MFPVIKVRLEGCDPDLVYYAYLDIIPVDDRRYRYVYNKSSWLVAGKAEPPSPSRLYMHPDCPLQGRSLSPQSQAISFEKAKLTNHEAGPAGHLVLNSMHKYQPRVHVVCREKNNPMAKPGIETPNLLEEDYRTFVFADTDFMAVTAYQNQLVTKLKIELNPFAKGFRDTNGRSESNELLPSINRMPFPTTAPYFFQQHSFIPQQFQTDMLLQTVPHPLNMALNLAAMQQHMAMAQGIMFHGGPRLGIESTNFLNQNGNKKMKWVEKND